jgi:diguanylate cyclase (GGDEF)-like protein
LTALVVPIAAAILLAFARGGSLGALEKLRVRWWAIGVASLLLQVALFSPLLEREPWVLVAGPWLYVGSMVAIAVVLARNALDAVPARLGYVTASLGVLLNVLVVSANGGYMPRLVLNPNAVVDTTRLTNTAPLTASSVLVWLGDVLVEPDWFPRHNILSVGDVLLALGLAGVAYSAIRFPAMESRRRFELDRRGLAVDVYIALIGALALIALVAGFPYAVPEPGVGWFGVAALFIALVVGESWAVPLPKSAAVSVSTVSYIVLALLLPPTLAGVLAGLSMITVLVWQRKRPSRVFFNGAASVATVALTALMAHPLGLADGSLGDGGLLELFAFLYLAAFNYAVNSLLVSVIVAIASGVPLRQVLFEHSVYSAPAEFAGAVLGVLIALVWLKAPNLLPLAVFPALISQMTLQYIAASNRRAAELRHLALHDQLTELPNRVFLMDELKEQLQPGRRAALLMLDLDRFKEVNDTFGHHYGDLLLAQVGPRLCSVLRESDTFARLGGDEFAVLLPGADAEAAGVVAQKLIAALEQPFPVEDQSVFVGGSIGVALHPDHGDDPHAIMRRADIAMYVAKRTHSGFAVYAPEHDTHSPLRLALFGELRQAVEHDDLVLHYQLQQNAASGEVVGAEALVRWPHAERGLIPPDEFIPLAEQTGMIRPLTRGVLRAAVHQIASWHRAGIALPVAVNLSAQDVQDGELPDYIASLLERNRLPSHLLRVEVTESRLMAEPERAMDVLTRLRQMGIGIAVDDFGTGYSSLVYLKRLPVDELKIDRSFVRHLATDENDAAIVRSTIDLGHALGLRVVAEGVEDESCLDLLRLMGCDHAQGYLFSRPSSAKVLTPELFRLRAPAAAADPQPVV